MNSIGQQSSTVVIIPTNRFFGFTEGIVFNATLGLALLTPILAMINLTYSLIIAGMIVVALTLDWANSVAYSELFVESGTLRQHFSYRPSTRFKDINLKDGRFIQLDFATQHKYVRFLSLAISGSYGKTIISRFGLGDKYIDENGLLQVPSEAKELKAFLIENFHFRDIGQY